ncbi:hypothetical protein [Levilactobacillus mulengensis]|uniref:hypothetical protein n=1 Tax=Levilactobacillus mulengensis TaxID=2486025 RepID=UPI000F78639D|nr:hypothetical protein [Levilactobacillus mulengensis]
MSYYNGPDEEEIQSRIDEEVEAGVKQGVKEATEEMRWQQIELEAHKGNKWAQQQWKQHQQKIENLETAKGALAVLLVIAGFIWWKFLRFHTLKYALYLQIAGYTGYGSTFGVWISSALILAIPIASVYFRRKAHLLEWYGVIWDTFAYLGGGRLLRQVIVVHLIPMTAIFSLLLMIGYTIFAVWALRYKFSAHQNGQHQSAHFGWTPRQRLALYGSWVLMIGCLWFLYIL